MIYKEMKDEYIKLVKEDYIKFSNLLREMFKDEAELTGFSKYYSRLHLPFVATKVYRKNSVSIDILNEVSIIIDGDGARIFGDMENGILNIASNIRELIDIKSLLELTISKVLSKIFKEEQKADWLRYDFYKLVQICDDVMKVDPNSYFSYDDEGQIYFYSPKYDSYISTYDLHNSQAIIGGSTSSIGNDLPFSLVNIEDNWDEPFLHNYKRSISINTRKYNENSFEELLKKMESFKLISLYETTNEKVISLRKFKEYDYTPTITEFNIISELAASTPIPLEDPFAVLRRARDDYYLFFDHVTKQAFKVKNVIEAYEHLYKMGN